MNSPARALFAACLFLVIFDLAAGNGAGLTRSAAFQAELDSLRHEYGFPGATAAYVLADGTGGEAATGFADRETATVMTPRSRLLSASIGKIYLAAATVALAGEGWLNLDLPVSCWLGDQPWFSRLPNHRQITLRHLLTHSSGLAEMLRAVPISSESDAIEYGAGVAIARSGSYGPVYGHGGWIPGYSSSLRYYPDHGVTVALQINTDIGIIDGGGEALGAMERRLAGVAIAIAEKSLARISK